MKAVVFTCSTGQGHNSAAKAVCEAFLRHNHECRVVDAMSFGSEKTSRVVSNSYINIAVKAPKVFGRIYKAGSAVSTWGEHSPVYLANTLYADRMYKFILDEHIDAAICTHIFPLEALTCLRRRGLPVDFFAVSTDYTCIPFWQEIKPNLNFIPHRELIGEMTGRGISRDIIVPSGIPVSARFNVTVGKKQARAALGISENSTVFLVMTGSMGFGNILDTVAELLTRLGGEATRVIVFVGHNKRLAAAIAEKYGSDRRVTPVGFTDAVPMYMDACDVLLSKPGGLSSTEAAVKNVPLVHTMPIPGCETCNAEFFKSRGLSLTAKSPAEAAEKAVSLSLDSVMRKKMLECQRSVINPHAADDICSSIEKFLA